MLETQHQDSNSCLAQPTLIDLPAFLTHHLSVVYLVQHTGPEAAHIDKSNPGQGTSQVMENNADGYAPLVLREETNSSSEAVASAEIDFHDIPISEESQSLPASPTASEGYIKIVHR